MKSGTRTLVSTLAVIACLLVVIHLVSQALRVYGGYGAQLGFERQFNLDEENNVPSWYVASVLMFCAILLGLIAIAVKRNGAPYFGQWLALAGICLFLSMDEASSLHEMTVPLGRALIDRAGLFTGYLYYSWVIFGMAAVAVVGLLYIRFLRDLPRATRRVFILAGLLYVGGAIGVELFGSKIEYMGMARGMTFAVLVAAEESLEMFGVVVFVYALLAYLRRDDIARSLLRVHGELVVDVATAPRAERKGSRGASSPTSAP